jgi:hypothetical protein
VRSASRRAGRWIGLSGRLLPILLPEESVLIRLMLVVLMPAVAFQSSG